MVDYSTEKMLAITKTNSSLNSELEMKPPVR